MDNKYKSIIPFPKSFKNAFKIPTLQLIVLAFLVGIVGGLITIAFRLMINFIIDATFSGKIQFMFDSNAYIPPSVWGIGIIFVPVLGGLLVSWLTENFAPEAKGHGVPEVLYAIHYKEGIIRPIVAIIKALASAISIGTGGSVGREGPIIQIGAAFGATLGQIIAMKTNQRIILIAAGAAAGIAATFSAPLAGVTFAIELILVSIDALSICLVTVAVVTATIIAYFFAGDAPLFIWNISNQNQSYYQQIFTILLFIPFGVLVGIISATFIYAIDWFENWFDTTIKNHYIRHAVGMFFVGIIFYLFMVFYGQYYTAGIGDATIQELLSNLIKNPCLLILLFVGKLLATCLTLGSGGSGGVFSPSLFLGATWGALYGIVVNYLFPGLNIDSSFFVLAGMAGMVGGTTSAFITAIIIVFEVTQNYSNILPVMITVAFAYLVRAYFSPESIYTLKIFRRGFSLPQGLQANMSRRKK